MLKRVLAALSATVVLLTGGLWAADTASAEPVSGCEDVFWFVLGQSTRRAICDGEVRPDGSWLRARVRYTPRHWVNARSWCSGGTYYSSCDFSPGYWVDYTEAENTTYIVFPHNVLPGEPPHLVNNVGA